MKDWKYDAKPDCKRCNGPGWCEGKDYEDGSFTTEHPCSCTWIPD